MAAAYQAPSQAASAPFSHLRAALVRAAADGVVTLAGDFYFAGRCVYVSHGAGFTTFYCHLSEISVKAGDEVKAGQTLGLSGKSGRVTGPHLHFSTAWRGIFFDPEPLLAE